MENIGISKEKWKEILKKNAKELLTQQKRATMG